MCGGRPGGPSLEGIDLSCSVIIQGQALRGSTAVSSGYVRLHDAGGDFIAEVPLSVSGQFRFFTREGIHSVKVLTPGASLERRVKATQGVPVDLILNLGES